MKIHFGFVRTHKKNWISLDKIEGFFISEDCQILASFKDEEVLIEQFENESQAQKELDDAFHYYYGYQMRFDEVCEQHKIDLSARLDNLLISGGIITVQQAYELIEKGRRLPGMGLKSWKEFSEATRKLRWKLP